MIIKIRTVLLSKRCLILLLFLYVLIRAVIRLSLFRKTCEMFRFFLQLYQNNVSSSQWFLGCSIFFLFCTIDSIFYGRSQTSSKVGHLENVASKYSSFGMQGRSYLYVAQYPPALVVKCQRFKTKAK